MPQTNQLPKYLDCFLAAEVLGIKPPSVNDLCNDGKFPGAIRLRIGWIIPWWEVQARASKPLPKGGRPVGYRPKPRKRKRIVFISGKRSRRRHSDLPPLLPREVAQAMARRAFELSTPQERQERASRAGLACAASMTPEQRQARARAGAAAREAKRKQASLIARSRI